MKAAVCHSDIHYAEGAWGGDLPASMLRVASSVPMASPCPGRKA